MRQHQEVLEVKTAGRGFLEITDRIAAAVSAAGIETGLLHVFCTHTSCSLTIQENADPSARHDMEQWLERIAPENDPHYTHTLEGPDDMPAHLRAILTGTSETIPVADGSPALGRWQGLYLCEHRRHPHTRRIIISVTGD